MEALEELLEAAQAELGIARAARESETLERIAQAQIWQRRVAAEVQPALQAQAKMNQDERFERAATAIIYFVLGVFIGILARAALGAALA